MADLPIGKALKRARELRKLTQAQMVAKMGCPRTYISKVENGHINPKIASLFRFAAALDTEAWRLLRWALRQKETA